MNINVMAHPQRSRWARQLAEQLGCDIIWDRHSNVWETRSRCLQHHVNSAAEHGLTLQDDAVLADSFLPQVRGFLEDHDPDAVNFYTWTARAGRRETRQGWMRRPGIRGGVAICLRVTLIPPLLDPAYADDWWPDVEWDRTRNDDSRISRYLRHVGVECWYPLPSLVDHRDEGSLVWQPGQMPARRRAGTFR